MAFHWRRLAFPTTFPFARTSLMKPARKLRPSAIRRRHGAMDDTTIQQEAAQRRPGRGQERRRASPPSSGRRSIDRTAAKATSGEGEGKGWERPGGNRMPRGTTRHAKANRATTCARISGKGKGREDKTSTSEQIGECRPTPYAGTDLFHGIPGCRSRLVLEVSGVPAHACRPQGRHFDTIVCQESPHEPVT